MNNSHMSRLGMSPLLRPKQHVLGSKPGESNYRKLGKRVKSKSRDSSKSTRAHGLQE